MQAYLKAMLILCTVMTELYGKGMKYFLPSVLALAGLAAASAYLAAPVSKNRVSASYVLVSVAVCCVACLLVDVFTKKLPGLLAVISVIAWRMHKKGKRISL